MAVPRVKIECGGVVRDVRVERNRVVLDGREIAFAREGMTLEVGGRRHRVAWARVGERVHVFADGRAFSFERAAAGPARSAEHAGDLVAPMPGRVRRLLVAPGQAVEKGQVVLILEAMKMEHALRAPRAGVLARLAHAEGELVEAGAELAVIEG